MLTAKSDLLPTTHEPLALTNVARVLKHTLNVVASVVRTIPTSHTLSLILPIRIIRTLAPKTTTAAETITSVSVVRAYVFFVTKLKIKSLIKVNTKLVEGLKRVVRITVHLPMPSYPLITVG